MAAERTLNVNFRGASVGVAAIVQESGPEWVLFLHGIQSNKALFASFFSLPSLASLSLIAIDFQGFGQSTRAPADFSYEVQDQAFIVQDVIARQGINALHLVGHSLGGMVGTLMLNPLAGVIRSFVNMEGNLVLADCGLSKSVIERSCYEFCATNQLETIRSELRNNNCANSATRAIWLENVADYAFYKTCESIVRWSSSSELLQKFCAADCRKLFLYGEENSHKAQCLPSNIKRACISDANHFMLQTSPHLTIKAVTSFILEEPG